MPIEVMFQDLVYRDTLSQFRPFNNIYYNKALEIQKHSVMNSKWKCDTFNTYALFDLAEDNTFDSLIKACQDKVNTFALEHGISRKIEYLNSWINIANKENFQEYHRHERSHFSLVYYVKTPLNCGNLIFKKDTHDDMFRLPFEDNPVNKTAGYDSYYIVPNECDIVIFKSSLLHMVEKNKNEDDRVSIAMNFYYPL